MYPIIGRIGGLEITSFGLMVAAGFLAGIWVFARELRRSGLPARLENAALVGAIGGMAGAKIVWAIEFAGQAPFTELLFSRAGLSWYGGLMGGIAAGIGALLYMRAPLLAALSAAAPALAVGHMLGRIGCFLVGDDYGTPSDLPWAVAFPQGAPPVDVPVHPTQIYEAMFLATLVWLLIRLRRHGHDDAAVLGVYFIAAGTGRFLIEFVRVNAPLVFGFTLAQVFAMLLIAAGVALAATARAGAGAARSGSLKLS